MVNERRLNLRMEPGFFSYKEKVIMRGNLIACLCLTATLCCSGVNTPDAHSEGPIPRMTKEDLKGRIGDTDLVIVDVRTEGSWAGSALKIEGAVRGDPTGVQHWMKTYSKEQTLVFYCS
jgi:hypothetical protein